MREAGFLSNEVNQYKRILSSPIKNTKAHMFGLDFLSQENILHRSVV